MWFTFAMVKKCSRRSFLRTAPAAAAAGLALSDTFASAAGQTAAAPEPFQIFTAQSIAGMVKTLEAAPGNKNMFAAKSLPFNVVMTTEAGKSPKEFEWHEGRDHIVQILDGTTLYEVGGTPKGPHSSRAGEWNSPGSDGAKSIMMVKGDMLVIPRNTPHKRSTEDSVTFILISTTGTGA